MYSSTEGQHKAAQKKKKKKSKKSKKQRKQSSSSSSSSDDEEDKDTTPVKIKKEKADVDTPPEKGKGGNLKKGRPFKNRSATLPKMDDEMPDIQSSGSDDLKCTYVSSSNTPPKTNSDIIDLTSSQLFSSTPKSEIQTPAKKTPKKLGRPKKKDTPPGVPSRKSPRGLQKKNANKSPSSNKPTSESKPDNVKKVLDYDTKPEAEDPALELAKKMSLLEGATKKTNAEDTNLRIVRLESLVTTMETQRREDTRTLQQDRFKQNEINGRLCTLLERYTSDRELVVTGFKTANKNQETILKGK